MVAESKVNGRFTFYQQASVLAIILCTPARGEDNRCSRLRVRPREIGPTIRSVSACFFTSRQGLIWCFIYYRPNSFLSLSTTVLIRRTINRHRISPELSDLLIGLPSLCGQTLDGGNHRYLIGHRRESAGTDPVALKVAPLVSAALSGSPMCRSLPAANLIQHCIGGG